MTRTARYVLSARLLSNTLNEHFRLCRFRNLSGSACGHKATLRRWQHELSFGLRQQVYSAADSDHLEASWPKESSAVVFFYDIVRDGGTVTHGEQFLFRSDVVYRLLTSWNRQRLHTRYQIVGCCSVAITVEDSSAFRQVVVIAKAGGSTGIGGGCFRCLAVVVAGEAETQL
jgi:hypothetical protein